MREASSCVDEKRKEGKRRPDEKVAESKQKRKWSVNGKGVSYRIESKTRRKRKKQNEKVEVK